MRWVKKVTTDSTFPPPETFNQSAKKIAETMADPKVSPKGLGSAIRMVQYFINRGGKNLSATRKRELEKAKHLLQQMHDQQQEKQKESGEASKPGKKKSAKHSGKKHAAKSTAKKKQRKKKSASKTRKHSK